jgi:hypothetical protein
VVDWSEVWVTDALTDAMTDAAVVCYMLGAAGLSCWHGYVELASHGLRDWDESSFYPGGSWDRDAARLPRAASRLSRSLLR